MPLQLPILDDRDYEQILAEAKRRIPAHTPEWTNFAESDPGITVVQLFAFLTESLLYRAGRIPERNRIKFLQLLGIPLQKAAAAEGIITIRNERGPIKALPLENGVVVNTGNVSFLTKDGVTILPVEAQIFYKHEIPESDPYYEEYYLRYQAVLAAIEASASPDTELRPVFYETRALTKPSPGAPGPALDLVEDTADGALYMALLAPENVPVDDELREKLVNQTLSIGIVPALADDVPPLVPPRRTAQRVPLPDLIYEIADVSEDASADPYKPLDVFQRSDVLNDVGIVQVILPEKVEKLQTWKFGPEQEGIGRFPPRIEDEEISKRIVTWIRIRLQGSTEQETQQEKMNVRLSWIDINATRVVQAVPVTNELLGTGTSEPDQGVTLANPPVITDSLKLEIQREIQNENQDKEVIWQTWRLVDDLLAADIDEQVFTLDPESGQIRFGTGLYGARPQLERRIRASYRYGGGPQGNVAIGEIKSSPDVRLQGGFRIENPIPTWGGDEGESVAEAERNIPCHLRHRDRLVTAQDFEDIAKRTPGVDVGRVEILPLFHPDAGPDTPGVVTVMVVPKHDVLRPHWPTPDRLFLHKVREHLCPRRLVTTEIHVYGPQYVAVHLSAGVQVRAGYFRDVVLQAVRERLEAYLSAWGPDGPEGEEGNGWPLNRKLFKKDLEAAITRIKGVDYVISMDMGVESRLHIDERQMENMELPLLATLRVREGDADPLEIVLGGGLEGVLGGGLEGVPVDGTVVIPGTTPSHARPVPIPVRREKC